MSREKLYDDLIMDHIKNARNYRVLEDVNRVATGSNPLCGDELTMYLRMGRDRIEDVSFQCASCGISMASASIMTELIRGMPAAAVRSLINTFVAALHGRADLPPDVATPGQRAIIATAREFPTRTRCAVLPWATLEGALDGREEVALAGR